MPQVFTSTVVGAPVGEVWALLRDFAAIGSWHPALPPCEIEDGPADRGPGRLGPLFDGSRNRVDNARVWGRRERLQRFLDPSTFHLSRA